MPLAPDPAAVLAAIACDRMMEILDAEKAALDAKEARRVGKIEAEIKGIEDQIKAKHRERVRLGVAIRSHQKHIRWLKVKTKHKLKPYWSITKRKAQRVRQIRAKVEKQFLRVKSLEFRAQLKVNQRPQPQPPETETETPPL